MPPKYIEIGYKSDLMQACSAGNLDRVRELLAENPASLRQVCDTGDTVLHFTARGGSIAIVQLLLEQGAELYAVNKSGETVFHTAAAFHHYDLVKYLLDKNYFTADSLTAGGQTESIEAHETEIVFNKISHTALHIAAEKGYKDVAELLLECGADINRKDANGDTPLHYAARNFDSEMIHFLVKHGADVNARDHADVTPAAEALLNIPSDKKNPDLIYRTLLKYGAKTGRDVLFAAAAGSSREEIDRNLGLFGLLQEILEKHSFSADDLNTALFFSVYETDYDGYPANTIKLLLKYGAKPVDKITVKGSEVNALKIAVIRGVLPCFRLLLKAGADVTVRDKQGNSLLMTAAKVENLRMLKVLHSEFGLPVDEVNSDGASPLLATFKEDLFRGIGPVEVVKYLLEHGADVNRRLAENGRTPLHLACMYNFFRISKILLEYGADKNMKDNGGKTPVELTESKTIRKLLET